MDPTRQRVVSDVPGCSPLSCDSVIGKWRTALRCLPPSVPHPRALNSRLVDGARGRPAVAHAFLHTILRSLGTPSTVQRQSQGASALPQGPWTHLRHGCVPMEWSGPRPSCEWRATTKDAVWLRGSAAWRRRISTRATSSSASPLRRASVRLARRPMEAPRLRRTLRKRWRGYICRSARKGGTHRGHRS